MAEVVSGRGLRVGLVLILLTPTEINTDDATGSSLLLDHSDRKQLKVEEAMELGTSIGPKPMSQACFLVIHR